MTGAPQRVQVFALAGPRPGATKDRRRWYVKWRVDGRDRTRAFKTRGEGDRFRSTLLVAVKDGRRFDPDAGVPVDWLSRPTGPTWWAWSREWLALKWPEWSGHSRRSAVETLVSLTPLLAAEGAPVPPADLGGWLRTVGYRPGELVEPAPEWLERWSVPLADIDPAMCERVIRALTTRADGKAMAASGARRRRGLFGAALRTAVRRGVLASNPLDRIELRAPAGTAAIDISTVPGPADIVRAHDHVAQLADRAARYAALFATVGLAGMRPSEAIGLHVDDLELPPTGWGLARLRGALTSPGTRYTADGAVHETKGLKSRADTSKREVPLPPQLVGILRRHLERFPDVDGRVFSNAADSPVTPTNYTPVWVRARSNLWPGKHPLAGTTVYDLRHAAATMMLRAGVPPAEVARRLGHSVDILMKVYAGVFHDERDRSNALIDAALASS